MDDSEFPNINLLDDEELDLLYNMTLRLIARIEPGNENLTLRLAAIIARARAIRRGEVVAIAEESEENIDFGSYRLEELRQATASFVALSTIFGTNAYDSVDGYCQRVLSLISKPYFQKVFPKPENGGILK